MKGKKIIKFVEGVILLQLLFVIGIITFFVPLVGLFISIDFSEDWAGPIWSLTGVCAVSIFSLLIYRHTKALESPIITAEPVAFNGKPYYIIKNIGQVSAMNILLFIRIDKVVCEDGKEGEIDYMVIIGSMIPNSQRVISWDYGIDKITITYQSFGGDNFTGSVIHDTLTTVNENTKGVDSRGVHSNGNKLYEEMGKLEFIPIESERHLDKSKLKSKWIRYSSFMQDSSLFQLAEKIIESSRNA